ncbi:MAG: hypothetical protein MUC95_10465, partial [Spirochaetes bacterium]|nr:hypothetical protein [Spirochaetota bacterium]
LFHQMKNTESASVPAAGICSKNLRNSDKKLKTQTVLGFWSISPPPAETGSVHIERQGMKHIS